MTSAVALQLDSSPNPLSWPDAAYIHIPFCRQRCYYCDFATGLGTADLIATYVQVLCQQIQSLPEVDQPLQTVFFGGGTPSLLTPTQLQDILSSLRARVPFARDIEISLEANPGTISRDQLAAYQEWGVNRISLGVQAFQPELLAACGRLHGVEAIYTAVEDLRAVGLNNFNLDLIFGLPHQTLADWRESLQQVCQIRPTHISLYDLTIEQGTRFGRLYHAGMNPLPAEEITVAMYLEAIEILSCQGYDHYEISNFAQPGFSCRHNRVYWENRSYYGLGMGATGYVQGRRIQQPQKLHDYFLQVRSGQEPTDPVATLADQWMDTLMLGLRLREGISLEQLYGQFPAAWITAAHQQLSGYEKQGWISWENGRIRLIPPMGWLHSNTIIAVLFAIPDPK
ncbi:MAG: coproporphyrinogen III oxidase [Synechococcaceae cyanobacterium SM2_3_1]|nr:coproporphyrinogen III oxidase [Synechococcaceae cyanobacterium SM2_3_1]